MYERKYHKLMGAYNSLTTDDVLWCNLFRSHQCFFSEKFLTENMESYIGTYEFQRYQEISIEMFEKIIHDDRVYHINCYDHNIPLWFYKKHIQKYHDKLHISNCLDIKGLDEETFVEFLSYPEIYQNQENLNKLWICVGAFNISEKFIKENLNNINKKYNEHVKNFISNPWNIILMNKIE